MTINVESIRTMISLKNVGPHRKEYVSTGRISSQWLTGKFFWVRGDSTGQDNSSNTITCLGIK